MKLKKIFCPEFTNTDSWKTCLEQHTSILLRKVIFAIIIGFGKSVIWISNLWVFLQQKPLDSVAVAVEAW